MTRYLSAILSMGFAAFLIVPASPALAQQNLEDVVYLKDGSVIRGVIIEQIPGASLKIQTRDGNVFFYEIDRVERITKEAPLFPDRNRKISRKNPALALVCSLLLAGGGQFYNEQYNKGAAFLLGAIVGGAIVGVSSAENAGPGAVIWLAATLGSAIDAPISANRINQQSQTVLLQYDAGRFAVGAGPLVQRGRIGGALRLRF